MSKLFGILVLMSSSVFATVNQLEFDVGRGTPQSSLQAGGSSERAGSRGTDWSVDSLHHYNDRTSFGFGGGQFRSNDHVSETFIPNTSSTISSKITSILILSKVDFPSQSKMTLYVIAGIGWSKNSILITDRTGTGTLMDQSHDTMAFATGMGADYPLSDRLVIGVEARYRSSLKRTFDLTPAGRALTGVGSIQSPLNVFTLGVKAGIRY